MTVRASQIFHLDGYNPEYLFVSFVYPDLLLHISMIIGRKVGSAQLAFLHFLQCLEALFTRSWEQLARCEDALLYSIREVRARLVNIYAKV